MAEGKKERRAAPRKPKAAGLADDEIRRLISEAAYYRAQARGFAPGYELEDWIAAEKEVKQRVGRTA